MDGPEYQTNVFELHSEGFGEKPMFFEVHMPYYQLNVVLVCTGMMQQDEFELRVIKFMDAISATITSASSFWIINKTKK